MTQLYTNYKFEHAMYSGLSIIIPTYNEAEGIQQLILYLLKEGQTALPEIVVSDGGSTDNTRVLAQEAGAKVVLSSKKGRAAQMNAGAAEATGSILYFLHADTFPHAGYIEAILSSCTPCHGAGCFRLRFDEEHWFLKLNSWFTRFNIDRIRFGDQSLFIQRKYFEKIRGFREELLIMEDQEIIYRIKKVTGFKVLPLAVTTSAKKYRENGKYKLQFIFALIWLLFYWGLPQQKLVSIYNSLIKKSKLKD